MVYQYVVSHFFCDTGITHLKRHTGGARQGIKISINRTMNKYLSLEVGARHYDETSLPATASSIGVAPYEGTTARAKLNVQVPQWDGASAYTEYEQCES